MAKPKKKQKNAKNVTQRPRQVVKSPIVPPLPPIKTLNDLWPRLLRTLDYAVMQHVPGFEPGRRPRIADPGWEDLLALQARVDVEVQAIQ